MTREEAITTLKEMHESFDEIHENTNGDIGYEQMTALDMAIEALSTDADGEDLIIKGAKGIKDGLYNIQDGKLFKYKANGGTVRTYPIVPSADAVQGEWIEKGGEIVCSVCGNSVSFSRTPEMAIEALSLANLKEEFESAECEDYEHATLVDIKEPLKVLVVRCKDCRYAMVRTEEEMNKPIKPQPILCEWFCIGVENDDYCSHGERKK